jgi:hypothetical protein
MRGATKRLFSAAVLLTTLLAAEAIARLAFRRPPAPFVASANQKLIYELNPSYPGINAQGMAQGPIALSTLHDRSVIAVIGDSHAYSIEMSNHAYGFPARLEHALNADEGERVTVLNFGVPGYNTVQELEVLRAKALPFEPDLIVLQYCINDEHISNYIQPRYPRINRAIHRSVLATTAWTTFLYSDFGRRRVLPYAEHAPDLLLFAPGLVGTPVSRDPDPAHGPTHPSRSKEWVPARYHDFIGRDNLERAVRTFGDICKRRGTPVLATGFIESSDERLYTEAGMQVYSFFTIFEGQDMRRYGYDPARTDGHFSVRGNDAIGKALARYVRDNFTLRRRG